ncbi:MAG: hypothetical protein ACTHN0_10480 [Aquihabitans sp.]
MTDEPGHPDPVDPADPVDAGSVDGPGHRDPVEPGNPDPVDPAKPGAREDGASGGAEAPTLADGTRSRRRPAPIVRWIRGLSQAAYAGLLVLAIALLLLVAILVNPGERVGPVQHADPPVGGPGLPATRL